MFVHQRTLSRKRKKTHKLVKIFVDHISDKGLVSRIHRKLFLPINKKQITKFKIEQII